MSKIVMIGPVYPYKSGISHYTGFMCRALKKKYDVDMISFKFQYPKLLFKKEQKDHENRDFKIDGTKYLIHTADPFNWAASARKILSGAPDLVIIQWWHPYFSPCYHAMVKRISKKTKILFVCHNVFPHERFPLDRWLTKRVLSYGDHYIVHSGQDEEDLLTIKPEAHHVRTVLPTFNAFKLTDLTKEKAREMLKIAPDKKVLLFFGFVREYKGLRHLIKALPMIRERLDDVKLLIVGDFGDDRSEYDSLIDELKVGDIIDIHDGYIPNKEVERYFVASDLAVLPYESATQSGIVPMAYGFELPVIVTDVGGLPEVVNDRETGYIVPPRDPGAISEKVAEFFENRDEIDFKGNIRKESYRFSWERMTEVIEELTGVSDK